MDWIMLSMLVIAIAIVSWTANQKDVREGRLAKRPVPVEKEHIKKRKVC